MLAAERDFNKQADHIANVALRDNSDANVLIHESWTKAVSEQHNLLLYVDGGFWPSESRAAAAWVLYCLSKDGAVPLGFQAALLHSQKTSFTAEFTALGPAIDLINQML